MSPDDYGCSCSIEAWDAYCDSWGFTEREVRARKVHNCCECGEEIAVGELHEVASACQEGDWWRERTCLPCARVRKAYCCTWAYGHLRETLKDHLGMDYITGELTEWAAKHLDHEEVDHGTP